MALPARLEVYQRLRKLRRERPLHLTLLDPGRSDTATIGCMARGAAEAGTDVIMVGGSTGLSLDRVDAAVLEIKEQSHLPVILFPTVAKAVSTKADAIFFMSLLNSTERRFLVGEQIASAAMVHQSGLQPLSMAYLIVEPGMAAARVGKAKPLPRDDPAPAVAHAMAGELFGMRFIYLEAGSGASQPVPPALVAAVREAIKVMLIVGGGIRTVDAAAAAVAAGADMVVTGTLVERASMVKEELQPIIGAVHAG